MRRSKLILVAALAPGWLIPRILGTLAFFAAPTLHGGIALVLWWTVVPTLWIVFRNRKRIFALAWLLIGRGF